MTNSSRVRSCIACLAVLAVAGGCSRSGSTAASKEMDAVPVVLPTLEMPDPELASGFTMSDCLVEEQILPHPCGIVPGETTTAEVPALIGERDIGLEDAPCLRRWPLGEGYTDACWHVDHAGVYFADANVAVLEIVLHPYELSLGQAVEILSPPEQMLFLQTDYPVPAAWWKERQADWAIFVWEGKRIILETELWGTQGIPLDEAEEIPPLPPDLPIRMLTAFGPAVGDPPHLLEGTDVWQHLSELGREIEWPGLAEPSEAGSEE